jgi:hypothetical protein
MWINVTENFSEEERHYKDTYLEISEVYDDKVEVSLFSSKDDMNEIYFSYGIMIGIIYVKEDEMEAKREEVKSELLEEYLKGEELSDEFIRAFTKKHNVQLPSDILFDMNLFDL